jgi:hypothetical protein
MPNFGIRLECGGSPEKCGGLPCSIDPAVNGVGQMTGPQVYGGAGGATGCTATAQSGTTLKVVVF